jgi:hypothetical protein
MVNAFAALEPFDNHYFFVPVLARNYEGDVLTNRFCSAVTKQPFGTSIPATDNSMQILADDRIVR